mmetsp:Transcript_16458/g.38970  ORF Transcript_16458/g.38970 Transcript_16458/m.38970 type:complete len:291 (-) Transcript_16458:96-968(-)
MLPGVGMQHFLLQLPLLLALTALLLLLLPNALRLALPVYLLETVCKLLYREVHPQGCEHLARHVLRDLEHLQVPQQPQELVQSVWVLKLTKVPEGRVNVSSVPRRQAACKLHQLVVHHDAGERPLELSDGDRARVVLVDVVEDSLQHRRVDLQAQAVHEHPEPRQRQHSSLAGTRACGAVPGHGLLNAVVLHAHALGDLLQGPLDLVPPPAILPLLKLCYWQQQHREELLNRDLAAPVHVDVVEDAHDAVDLDTPLLQRNLKIVQVKLVVGVKRARGLLQTPITLGEVLC